MRNFSILGDENRVVEGWGGAAQLCAGKKLCSPNPSKIAQKKFLTRRTPFIEKMTPRNLQFLVDLKLKIEFALSLKQKFA